MNPRTSLALLALVVCSSNVCAEENKLTATLIGENYCLHCSLVMADQPDAECGPESCSYALKVSEANDGDGKTIETLVGVTLHYITSDASQKLRTDESLYNQDVEIKGTVFVAERAVYVEEAILYDEFADFDELEISPGGNKASAVR